MLYVQVEQCLILYPKLGNSGLLSEEVVQMCHSVLSGLEFLHRESKPRRTRNQVGVEKESILSLAVPAELELNWKHREHCLTLSCQYRYT